MDRIEDYKCNSLSVGNGFSLKKCDKSQMRRGAREGGACFDEL
jgi:hypothetical protein